MSDLFGLREGEEVLHQQTASANGRSIWGGTLVLTNQRLMFRPLDVGVATAVMSGGGVHLGPKSIAVPTSFIEGVEPGSDPGLFHPPSLVLTLRDGTRVVIGICASRFTPNISRRNRTARDHVVELIKAQLTAGGPG